MAFSGFEIVKNTPRELILRRRWFPPLVGLFGAALAAAAMVLNGESDDARSPRFYLRIFDAQMEAVVALMCVGNEESSREAARLLVEDLLISPTLDTAWIVVPN